MRDESNDMRDDEGFLAIVEKNSGIISKICYYYAEDADDFEDLRQDVLANMWACRASFKGNSSLSTWIYRVALNTCISAFRRRKPGGRSIGVDYMPELIDDTPDVDAMHKEMHQLIGRLNRQDKAVILMWLDGLSYDEIASVVGCTRNAIAVRLNRIKDKIVRMSNE